MTDKCNQIGIIFDNMPYLAWMKDRNGRFLEVNRTFKEFCCKKDDEIIGKSIHEVVFSKIADDYQQIDNAVMKHKKKQFLDHIYQEGPTGSKWFDTYVVPLFDENGEVEGTIGFSRKISKRKHLEMELENQKRFLRTMMDTIPDIIVYKDNNSRILGCNKACLERFYGAIEEQEVIGKTTFDLIKDDELAKECLQKDQEVFKNNEAQKYEEKYVLDNGNVIDVETVKTPFHDERSSVAGLIAISRDITARKKLEKELRRREQETQWELELAAKVQKDALPLPFAGTKVRVNTLFSPYHSISGDLFNYKWFEDEDKLCGYIVDVSGHGVATALQTATIKMMLDYILLGGKEVKEDDFKFINHKMQQYLHEESFAGVMYFEFNFQTSTLKMISGGINLFLVAKPGKCSLIPIFSRFLGMFDEIDVQTITMPFKAGEIYCMMTDGVSDLLEMNGVRSQKGMPEYTAWLEEVSKSIDRSDDCSSVIVGIIQTKKELNLMCNKDDAELAQTQRTISDFLERYAPSCAVTLEVAVNEAVNNSLSVSGHARIKVRRMRDKIIVRVKDDGPGFNTKNIEASLKAATCEALDEIELNDRGRGILLMKEFCDRVIYNAKGNEVLLVKNQPLTERCSF